MDSADTFIPAITAVIGIPPVETFLASGDYRTAAQTRYEWPGLLVVEWHFQIGGPGPEPIGQPALWLRATEPVVGKVEIRTTQGIQPGDSVTSAAAILGVNAAAILLSVPEESGPILGPSRLPGQENAYAVAVETSATDPSAVMVVAPYNFGDGRDL